MIDHAARHLVVAREPREDRQPRSVGGRPARRAKRIRLQIPHWTRARSPGAALRVQRVELVQLARTLVEQQRVPVAVRLASWFDVHALRDRILPAVALDAIVEKD